MNQKQFGRARTSATGAWEDGTDPEAARRKKVGQEVGAQLRLALL
jgi:hypothetical protein